MTVANSRMALSTKKILVVDNHPLIVNFLVDFLRKQDQEVLAAHDALTALQLLDDFQPGIIFVDLVMPGISGDQLCRIIRSRPEFQDTFIVILSAVAAEEKMDFLAFGANACIAKGPFTRLAEHILAVLQQNKAGDFSDSHVLGLEDAYVPQITQELLSSRQRLESILSHINEGVVETTTDCTIIFTNPVVQSLFDQNEEKLLASDFRRLFAPEEERRLTLLLRQMEQDGSSRNLAAVPYRAKRLDMTIVPITSWNGRTFLIIIRDISKALRLEHQLQEASITDHLTGLLNRRGFFTLAEKQLQIAVRKGSQLHLLFADFDGLKKINDTVGHLTGDQALCEAAALLRNTFRGSDIIGRIGGDEFAVLLTCFSGDEDQQSVLDRLAQNMVQDRGERRYALSLSCGVAKFDPPQPCSLEELISRADQQMYLQKKSRKVSDEGEETSVT
jgi:diguanylate cyclase (GGDEF)-like protein/PAS domain S-box-containing protein